MTARDRTPKPCHHQRVHHRHGTRLAYKLDGCRCAPCSAAAVEYARRWDRNRAYGRPTTTWVDAAPVRAHVEQLQTAGMGWRTVCARAGVPRSTVSTLLFGRHGRAPSRRINPEVARKLLAVPVPTAADLAAHAVVDGTGTRRRLQALACLGWSVNRLTLESDLNRQSLDAALRGGQVLARNARGVAALYERLWDQPAPAEDHRSRISAARAINRAATAGWAPPMAWDDESIDNPDARPLLSDAHADVDEDRVDEHAIELVLDGQPMTLTGRDLEVAVDRLADRGLSYADIAARVRSDEKTVRRIRNNAQARASRAAAREETAA